MILVVERKINNRKLTDIEKFIFNQALLEVKQKADIEKMLENVKRTVLGLNKQAIKKLEKFAQLKVERLN